MIVMPAWHDRVGEFENVSDLPKRLREENRAILSKHDLFYREET